MSGWVWVISLFRGSNRVKFLSNCNTMYKFQKIGTFSYNLLSVHLEVGSASESRDGWQAYGDRLILTMQTTCMFCQENTSTLEYVSLTQELISCIICKV